MANRDLPYWVATSAIPGVGTATFNYLLKYFKTLKKFWEADRRQMEKLKVDMRLRQSILEFRAKVDPQVYLQTVYERGIKVFALNDRDYPENLRKISDAPPVLYVKGRILPQDSLAIGVVGARYATIYGRQVTEKLVFGLVNSGTTIVSGMARGIDSFAHRSALEAGGRTIAVLGSGVDLIYPPENKGLYEAIIKNGAVVSEFPLGFPSMPSNFPARNRIISGLSLGVLVTEAAVDSGSLITAGQAAEQGREVFAVPGPIYSTKSQGTNYLIQKGAKLVSSVEDILEEYGKFLPEAKTISPTNQQEAKILEILYAGTPTGASGLSQDEITRGSGLDASTTAATLMIMEVEKKVRNLGNGKFVVYS